MTSPRKTCTQCKIDKPLAAFSIDRTRTDGLSKWCKECVSARNKIRYAANRDAVLARQADRRAAEPERTREIAHRSYQRNRDKKLAYNRDRYRQKREQILLRSKEWHRFRRYGLTAEMFAALLTQQDGKCAICGTKKADRWHVDHDHRCCPTIYTCGKCIRGILCHTCNAGIGMLGDDPALCQRAADYLSTGPISPRT